jgi:hypothetical protein
MFFCRIKRHRIHAHCHYLESAPLYPAYHFADKAPLHSIGFDHHVRALQCLTLLCCFSSGFSSRFGPCDLSGDPSEVQITLAFGRAEIEYGSIFPGIKLACTGFYSSPAKRAFPFFHDLTLTLISLLLVRSQAV